MTKLTTGELKVFTNILIQGGNVLDLTIQHTVGC